MMKTYLVKNIPEPIYRQLINLNAQDRGLMRRELVAARKLNSKEDRVFLLLDHSNMVLSWIFLAKDNAAMFWTRRGYRRQGLATKVTNFMKKYVNEEPSVWVGMNHEFFESINLTKNVFDINNIAVHSF